MTQNSEPTPEAPAVLAYRGYRPPAVSVRATYTVGEVTDEIVVDIDQGPVDVDVIRGVIDAMTEKRDAAIEVDARDTAGRLQVVTNATDRPEPVLTGFAGWEAQA